jgi:hypothetical protein
MIYTIVRAGAGAASRYGSGSGSDQMMRLLAALQHWKLQAIVKNFFSIIYLYMFKRLRFLWGRCSCRSTFTFRKKFGVKTGDAAIQAKKQA